MASIFFLSLLIFSDAVKSQDEGTCYSPQGAPLEGQQACNAFQQVSSCCPTGTTCFSNQLCILTDPEEVSNSLALGAVLRGGCTNPLWSNSICGSFCLNNGDDGSITRCGNEEYCCQSGIDDGSCNCDTHKGVFSLADGVAQTIIGVSGLDATTVPPLSLSSTRASSAASTNAATTASFTSKSTLASFLQRSSGSSASAASTASATSTESAASQSSSAAASPSGVHTTGAKVGIGLGCAAFVLLILLILWFLHSRGKWPFRQQPHNPYPYPTNDISNDSNPTANVVAVPQPHPYEPSRAGSSPTPISTPPPQVRPAQSHDLLGIAPVNNPYDSAYSLPARGPDSVGNPARHPYGGVQTLERVGESSVPPRRIELTDLPPGRNYGDPRRSAMGAYDV